MILKYADDLKRYPDCPPPDAVEVRMDAFRFVHDGEDARNFTPPAKINPNRIFRGRRRCDSLALSMFVSRESAVEFFVKLRSFNKRIHKSLGTKVARVPLETSDGVATPPRDDGHFSLHESKSAELGKKCEVVDDLPIGESQR